MPNYAHEVALHYKVDPILAQLNITAANNSESQIASSYIFPRLHAAYGCWCCAQAEK